MHCPRSRILASARRLTWAALALLAAACATPARKQEAPVFFPPPPELPRLQFLTAFSGRKDIEQQSGFNKFVVGELSDVKFDKPYGVAMHAGKIYVCDSTRTVIVLDLAKKTFAPLAGALAGPGLLKQPINISIERDGTKYVTDPVRAQVVVFDSKDAYVKAYGQPGPWRPVDAVPFEGRLYVADNANGVIKVFDKASGEVVKTIGDQGDPANRLDRPTNLAFDHDGYLYVTDISRFQVVKFDRDGHFQSTFGRAGDGPGQFARPKGVALDRENHVYAVDAAFSTVQIFNREGRLLMFFGEGGEKPGNFTLPAKVAIDYDNLQYFRDYAQPGFEMEYLVLVTSQFGPRLVNVLAYGHEKGKRYPTDAEILKLIEEQRQKALAKPAAPPAEAPAEKPPEKPPVQLQR